MQPFEIILLSLTIGACSWELLMDGYFLPAVSHSSLLLYGELQLSITCGVGPGCFSTILN